MDRLVRQRLGKYEIRSVLGRGAMGTVYEGWDPVISRRVAIKTVRLPDSDDSEEREQLGRFQQEAQAAGRLQHPNIVGVFDYAETGELAYIVMEFVDGRTLKSIVDGGARPDLAEVGQLMNGLLTGLAYSHGHGVIHRDIKPANIIVTPGGQVKIADFGIARIESSTMTQAGSIMGTPAYMSPEQFQGAAVDTRTDIYSSGVVLFQLLTGKRPFEGSMATIMHAVLNSPAPRPSALDSAVPRSLDAIVARAIARAPEDRYPDAAAFNRALQAAVLAPDAPAVGVVPEGLGDLLRDDPTIVSPTGIPEESKQLAVSIPVAAIKPTPVKMPLVLLGVAALVTLGGAAFWALSGHGGKDADVPPGVATAQPPALPSPPTVPDVLTAAEPMTRPTTPERPQTPPPDRPDRVLEPTSSIPEPSIPAPSIPAPSIPAPSVPASSVTGPSVTGPSVPAPFVAPPVAAPGDGAAIATAMATPSPEAMRRAIASALHSAPCSFTTGNERAGTPVLRGLMGAESGARALHGAVQEAAPGQAFDWRVAEVDDRYCAVLDLLRPYARPFGATGRTLRLGLADGRTELTKDELLLPRLVLPEGPSYLQLDYFASDGTVTHLHDARPGPSYPTDAAPGFGDPRPGFTGWGVDAPFGTDLVVAVAASAPLFRTGQILPGTTDGYLRQLQTALAQITRTGARVSAFVLPVQTRQKP